MRGEGGDGEERRRRVGMWRRGEGGEDGERARVTQEDRPPSRCRGWMMIWGGMTLILLTIGSGQYGMLCSIYSLTLSVELIM